MVSLRTIVIAGALMSGLAFSADAADYRLPREAPVDEPVIAELGTGWYLRGDVGYVDYLEVKEGAHGLPDRLPRDSIKLENTFSVGGGIGYKFNNWFRADATFDYRDSAKFRMTSGLPGPAPFDEGNRTERALFMSSTVLVNAYVDLGAWSGVTPYVGAGVGVAQNRFHRHTSQERFFPAHPFHPTGVDGDPDLVGPLSRHPSKPEYNVAWALMGGLAVDVGYGFLADLGYRYVHVGGAQTRVLDDEYGIKTKHLNAHEARFGLRYMID